MISVVSINLCLVVARLVSKYTLELVKRLVVCAPKVSTWLGLGEDRYPHESGFGKGASCKLGDDGIFGSHRERDGTMPKQVLIILDRGPTLAGRRAYSPKGVEGLVVDGGEASVVVDYSLVVLVVDLGKGLSLIHI